MLEDALHVLVQALDLTFVTPGLEHLVAIHHAQLTGTKYVEADANDRATLGLDRAKPVWSEDT